MPSEEDIRSRFCISPELQTAGEADISERVLVSFTLEFCSGTPELVLGPARSKWVLLNGADLVESDKWHDGDLGEKKGDWFAEKKNRRRWWHIPCGHGFQRPLFLNIIHAGIGMIPNYGRHQIPCKHTINRNWPSEIVTISLLITRYSPITNMEKWNKIMLYIIMLMVVVVIKAIKRGKCW